MVIGAGVIGLAVARVLQLTGREVILLEAQDRFGTGASSRNSEVIHAGIYYTPGSLKAALCVRGRHLLYEYCAARSIPHRRLGKLIVAVEKDEESMLYGYMRNAMANGVHDLRWLSAAEVQRLEPAVTATAGLFSPSTGIVDSHELMRALFADFSRAGGHFVPCSTVTGGVADPSSQIRLDVEDGGRTTIMANVVINSAGIHAPMIARLMSSTSVRSIPEPHYAIGHYFSLRGKSPFSRLVYPVASRGGLGIHVTLDITGAARFGPDVEWIDRVDYAFDENRKPHFVEAIRRYYPTLEPERLVPAYTGIRAKINGKAEPAADFRIIGPPDTGHPGLVHLLGIESPGLTAALAIAEHVAGLVQ